jgi:hypothetical protein
MENIVLITSIIKTPNIPLSYGTRSIYTSEERFEQTKLTIQSIREKIPNCKIFIVECSELSDDEKDYFIKNCDYVLNLYNNIDLRNKIYSRSKALGEGTMTISALDFLKKNNIYYNNLIKVSGRYFLSENFNIENFINDDIVIKYIDNNDNNVFTGLYKLPIKCIENFKEFLQYNYNNMVLCMGYECLFAQFIKTQQHKKQIFNPIGLKGYVSVSNDFYNG